MFKIFGRFSLVFAVLAACLAFNLGAGRPMIAQTKDTKDKSQAKDKDKDAKQKVDPAKLKPDAATVQAQVEKVQAYYKEVFDVEKVPLIEKAHFLVVGGPSGTASPAIADELEQVYAKACKALKTEKDPGPWQGKLAVLIVHDAAKYPQTIRLAQRRRADEDEIGSHSTDATVPHVVVCATKTPGELGLGARACVQMASLLVDLKLKNKAPNWLAEGFGRATTLYILGTNALAADRRKASAYLTKKARTLNDISGNDMPADELGVLRGSFVDYLAYSGRTAKFLPILEGLEDNGKGQPGNLDGALKLANTSREDLTKNWTSYAKSFK
jgi:hypothetical protein